MADDSFWMLIHHAEIGAAKHVFIGLLEDI